jgi:hypothetical protein
MVLSHRRYGLPHEGDLADTIDRAFERGGLSLAVRYLTVVHKAVVLPVYGYDHGELHLKAGERTYPFDCAWDSGLAGVIYAKRADVAKLWEDSPMPSDEQIAEWLAAEVTTYDQWARGETYGYIVEMLCQEHTDGVCRYGEWEVIHSCWGYYDADEALQEGVSAAAGEKEKE